MNTTREHPASAARPASGRTVLGEEPRRWRDLWPVWSARAAALWSAVYGCLGAWWMVHPAGFPFGVGPASGPASSVFAGLRPETGAPAVAVLGFAGGVVAIALSRTSAHVVARGLLLAFALVTSTMLLLLVPDARVLAAAAYAPIFLVGAPFGWPPVSYWEAIPWPIWYQLGCIAGGFLWGATALAFFRRTRGACVACGRRDVAARWTSPAAAARWGAWAASVAVVAPLVYAATRLAWVVGVPLGISDSLLREVRSTGMMGAAAGLASVAICGAVLTVGLVRPWGEVFPRWMPILRGRRVPPVVAIAPASCVSVLVLAAGLGIARDALRNGLATADFAAHAPGLLWPFWGLGLGAATLAYHYRRRGRCARCGRL
jgi:hypothetical protein